jgi:hypothetical protein
MTRDERLALHREWQAVLAEQLLPLLQPKGKGLAALRLFYILEEPDGHQSAGQLGVTPDGRQQEATQLVRSILRILGDPEGTSEERRVDRPGKT